MRLDTIPGINARTAQVVIAEIGVDMSRFPSEHHLASWAGLCPGSPESAGKHKAGTTRKGNRWLRMALIEVALAAIRKKDGAFGARYPRVMRHRGHKKAVVAVAHSLLRTHATAITDRASSIEHPPRGGRSACRAEALLRLTAGRRRGRRHGAGGALVGAPDVACARALVLLGL